MVTNRYFNTKTVVRCHTQEEWERVCKAINPRLLPLQEKLPKSGRNVYCVNCMEGSGYSNEGYYNMNNYKIISVDRLFEEETAKEFNLYHLSH